MSKTLALTDKQEN